MTRPRFLVNHQLSEETVITIFVKVSCGGKTVKEYEKHIQINPKWRDNPMSETQRLVLEGFGIPTRPDMSMLEAYNLYPPRDSKPFP